MTAPLNCHDVRPVVPAGQLTWLSASMPELGYSDEVQQRPRGQREQCGRSLEASGEAGLLTVWAAGARCVDADRGASHGSAELPGGERPVDGGIDGELGAAQRPVGSDSPGAAHPSGRGGGLDRRVESLGPDVPGDRALVEEVTGLKVKGGVQ